MASEILKRKRTASYLSNEANLEPSKYLDEETSFNNMLPQHLTPF